MTSETDWSVHIGVVGDNWSFVGVDGVVRIWSGVCIGFKSPIASSNYFITSFNVDSLWARRIHLQCTLQEGRLAARRLSTIRMREHVRRQHQINMLPCLSVIGKCTRKAGNFKPGIAGCANIKIVPAGWRGGKKEVALIPCLMVDAWDLGQLSSLSALVCSITHDNKAKVPVQSINNHDAFLVVVPGYWI